MKIFCPNSQDLIEQALKGHQWPSNLAVIEAGSSLPEGIDAGKCIGISDTQDPAEILHWAMDLGIRHLVSLQQAHFAENLKVAAIMLTSPEDFFQRPLEVILSQSSLRLLDAPPPKIQTQTILNSEQKSQWLDNIIAELKRVQSGPLVESVTTIADELIMNAAYDAPHAKGFTQSGDRKIYLRPVEVSWGSNESAFAISVRDNFGTLKIEQALYKMLRFYQLGAARAMNMGPGGAGIGLGLVFEQCTALHFALEPDLHTTVCCSLPLGKSRRALAQSQKNLHILAKKSL